MVRRVVYWGLPFVGGATGWFLPDGLDPGTFWERLVTFLLQVTLSFVLFGLCAAVVTDLWPGQPEEKKRKK